MPISPVIRLFFSFSTSFPYPSLSVLCSPSLLPPSSDESSVVVEGGGGDGEGQLQAGCHHGSGRGRAHEGRSLGRIADDILRHHSISIVDHKLILPTEIALNKKKQQMCGKGHHRKKPQ